MGTLPAVQLHDVKGNPQKTTPFQASIILANLSLGRLDSPTHLAMSGDRITTARTSEEVLLASVHTGLLLNVLLTTPPPTVPFLCLPLFMSVFSAPYRSWQRLYAWKMLAGHVSNISEAGEFNMISCWSTTDFIVMQNRWEMQTSQHALTFFLTGKRASTDF